jgi:hypothetical protein
LRLRLVLLAAVALVAAALTLPRHGDPLTPLPRLVLWTWESPQDLRFVKPGSAALAFLARSVFLNGQSAHSVPRLQPLRYTPGTDLIAVVRLESTGAVLPQPWQAVDQALPALKLPGVRALQIDFDARQSERAWYLTFLDELRRKMPAGMPLTMTALESWCEEDGWIRRAPVADATPMLFRLGPGERREPLDFPASICRSSVGVSTDELPARVPRGRRLYFFHPGPWTHEAYQAAVAQAARWSR